MWRNAIFLLVSYQFSITDGIRFGEVESTGSLFPWALQISLWNRESDFRSFDQAYRFLPSISKPISICGGTLLSPDIVLTAAHCLRDPKAIVMIAYNQELYRANYVHISPRYNPREQWYRIAKHDWALLQLERKIPLNDLNCQSTKRPVPSIWINQTDGITKKRCFLIGFGQTEDPSYTIWPPVQKMAEIISMKGDPTFNTVLIESTHRNAVACQGDSGGPVVCQIDNKWYAIGLLIGGTFYSTRHRTHLETCLNIKKNAFVPFETLFSEFDANGRTTSLMTALKDLGRFDDVIRFQKCH